MNYENAHDITNSNSGNYYSYTYVTNHITDSFNTKHKNSHNGHGRGAVGCLLPVLVIVLPALALLWFAFSLLASVLT
ncbi:MAG: hypothetical protein DYG89_15095 [Caldilinea sp. CFX5]|nr:hypothetical protein [Caldilinea sp. CFX5]